MAGLGVVIPLEYIRRGCDLNANCCDSDYFTAMNRDILSGQLTELSRK